MHSRVLHRQAGANSVDPDDTPQNAASHQGLHCLPLIQLFKKYLWLVNSTKKIIDYETSESIIIFLELIDQLIDYTIYRGSLNSDPAFAKLCPLEHLAFWPYVALGNVNIAPHIRICACLSQQCGIKL